MSITCAAEPLAGAGRGRASSLRRWVLELGLLALLYAGYLASRAAIGVQQAAAEARGTAILDLEAALFLDIEKPMNALVHAVPFLGLVCAYLYATLHYVLTPALLVWIAARRPGGYSQARNALLVATVIGLVGYWLLPTAPPRLIDSGFTDTMAAFSDAGWWGDAASAPKGMEGFSNQYAALPSLHVGWALWVAIYLRRYSSSPLLRRYAWTYPALMTVVVMATANHYLVDALAGLACVYAGSRVAGWYEYRRLGAEISRQAVP